MHKILTIGVIIFFVIFLIYVWIKGSSFIKGSILLGLIVGALIGASVGIVAFGSGINGAYVFGPLGSVIGVFIATSFSKDKNSEEQENSSETLESESSKISSYTFFIILFSIFILIIFLIFLFSSNKNPKKIHNWRLDAVYKDEIKTCEKQIIQKNPNVNIVELKSYKSFQIIRDNNQIKKIITYDVKKNVFILGEMSFGTFDCYLDLKNDATFSFLRLIQK
jgi:hypothetical protein